MIDKKISERAHHKLIDKNLFEQKFKFFKENVVTDFTTKVGLALVCKNLEVLNVLVNKLGKFNISLVNEHLNNKFNLDKVSYKDIEWALLNPAPYSEEIVSPRAESYNKLHTDKQCIALLKKREALVSELNNPKVSKLTVACLEKAIKDIEDVVRYSVANHVDEDSPLTMKKELEDFVKSLDNKNEILNSFDRNPIMDEKRAIIQNGEMNESSLKDALKTLESFVPGSEVKGDLKAVLKQLLSYSSVDDGSAERMLTQIKELRGMIAEQKRSRINEAFSKDEVIHDEIFHDINHLQNMVNEGGIQPECDEVEEALVERVLPIVHSSEIDEDTSEFVKVLTSNPNNKNYDIFEDKNGTISFMTDSNMSEEDADELYTSLSQKINKQAESSPVRLYSSSVKDHFDALEDIDHWEKKDKE